MAALERNNAKEERDQRRGYAINMKRVVVAYGVELVIIATSLVGYWLLAHTYGHNDDNQIMIMMLAPIAYAVIEFCRVPLAISARVHASAFVRVIAVIGVICASGVTIKSISQLGQMMFEPLVRRSARQRGAGERSGQASHHRSADCSGGRTGE